MNTRCRRPDLLHLRKPLQKGVRHCKVIDYLYQYNSDVTGQSCLSKFSLMIMSSKSFLDYFYGRAQTYDVGSLFRGESNPLVEKQHFLSLATCTVGANFT